MKHVALAEIKDDFSHFLREAAKEELVITRHGKPAGVLVGFATEDDWLDHQMENSPEFLNRIAAAQAALQRGEGISLSDYKRALADSVQAGPTEIRFDNSGSAMFTPANLEETKSFLVEKMQKQLKGHHIRSYGREIIVDKKAMPQACQISRAKAYFKRDFENALAEVEAFLVKTAPKNWENLALDLIYRDDGFEKNEWRDNGFLSARWVKTGK